MKTMERSRSRPRAGGWPQSLATGSSSTRLRTSLSADQTLLRRTMSRFERCRRTGGPSIGRIRRTVGRSSNRLTVRAPPDVAHLVFQAGRNLCATD